MTSDVAIRQVKGWRQVMTYVRKTRDVSVVDAELE